MAAVADADLVVIRVDALPEGVEPLPLVAADDLQVGQFVVAIGSPADKAGLAAADPNTGQGGDLIVAIDGQQTRNFSDLNSYLVFHTEVGQTIQITAFRNGRETQIQLVLGARP